MEQKRLVIKKISEGKKQNRITVPKSWKGYVVLRKLPKIQESFKSD